MIKAVVIGVGLFVMAPVIMVMAEGGGIGKILMGLAFLAVIFMACKESYPKE